MRFHVVIAQKTMAAGDPLAASIGVAGEQGSKLAKLERRIADKLSQRQMLQARLVSQEKAVAATKAAIEAAEAEITSVQWELEYRRANPKFQGADDTPR